MPGHLRRAKLATVTDRRYSTTGRQRGDHRRADTRLAGYWALELWHSGFGNYVWKRLLTVSAEDV